MSDAISVYHHLLLLLSLKADTHVAFNVCLYRTLIIHLQRYTFCSGKSNYYKNDSEIQIPKFLLSLRSVIGDNTKRPQRIPTPNRWVMLHLSIATYNYYSVWKLIFMLHSTCVCTGRWSFIWSVTRRYQKIISKMNTVYTFRSFLYSYHSKLQSNLRELSWIGEWFYICLSSLSGDSVV